MVCPRTSIAPKASPASSPKWAPVPSTRPTASAWSRPASPPSRKWNGPSAAACKKRTIALPDGELSVDEAAANAEIVRRIWKGEERFPDLPESPRVQEYLAGHTPRLFRLYEALLNCASRDRNVASARRDPTPWRVPGSLEFLQRLHASGAKNYFVTGAVITDSDPPTGMLEEVLAVGFEVGPGLLVEALHGSSWEVKMPKDEVMRRLLIDLDVAPEYVLVVGDGRSEIQAGASLGAAVLSRLPADAHRPRELHRTLGTNYIVTNYEAPALARLLQEMKS